MRVCFDSASVQIKNGDTRRVLRGQSWGTEGNAVVVAADAEGFEITSQPAEGER